VLVFDDDPVFCGLDLSLLAHVPDIATGVGIGIGIGILEPVTNRAFTEWSPFFGTIAHLVQMFGNQADLSHPHYFAAYIMSVSVKNRVSG